ncbi:hypothetical protein HBI38_097130 [Parastagonospora nodorum]|nr:hypothetical protein HBI73_065480 [Parastagonospora nodorum]KAH6094625.1 hypothetical protein HBI65_122150 [Parastagonospora nodorum]KAH6270294.1 hypothetical protein HBI41_083440 [Parastagonospora nodorum]KAH6290080.1 hypothetical protein HBI40_095040 [Parastagonospora nodorum]KAH6321554.1 hypothetical protein HBI38_097130 [Parastagonospora nodorum]
MDMDMDMFKRLCSIHTVTTNILLSRLCQGRRVTLTHPSITAYSGGRRDDKERFGEAREGGLGLGDGLCYVVVFGYEGCVEWCLGCQATASRDLVSMRGSNTTARTMSSKSESLCRDLGTPY